MSRAASTFFASVCALADGRSRPRDADNDQALDVHPRPNGLTMHTDLRPRGSSPDHCGAPCLSHAHGWSRPEWAPAPGSSDLIPAPNTPVGPRSVSEILVEESQKVEGETGGMGGWSGIGEIGVASFCRFGSWAQIGERCEGSRTRTDTNPKRQRIGAFSLTLRVSIELLPCRRIGLSLADASG